MTTEYAEVTETPTLDTTETIQADTPVESTPPLDGDTGQQETVDAAPANDDVLEQSYQSFVQEQSGKESGEPAPEPGQREQERAEPRVFIDPQQHAIAKRAYDTTYVRTQQSIAAIESALKDALGDTIARELTQPLRDRQNEMHANGMKFWGMEAARTAEATADSEWVDGLQKAQMKFVPQSQRKDFEKWFAETAQKNNGGVPHEAWLEKAFELKVKHEGYVSKDKHEAEKKTAFFAGARIHDKQRTDANSGQAVSGSPGDTRSEDALLADPSTPVSTIEKILARRGM